MRRLRSLNRYQKGILLLLAAMILVFTVLYPVTIAREGISYQGAILVPQPQADGATVYSGRLQGEPARFTVTADKTVTFQWGDKTYGPYTAREDPTAIPEESELRTSMTGMELWEGGDLLFRGGVMDTGDGYWLYNEDGTPADLGIRVRVGNGVVLDENGRAIDPVEPSCSTILELMAGPTLTHHGNWAGWCLGVLFCATTAALILFADELFRWSLSFRIRNADRAEPSDWEIASRYISWTVLSICVLALFITGLQ